MNLCENSHDMDISYAAQAVGTCSIIWQVLTIHVILAIQLITQVDNWIMVFTMYASKLHTKPIGKLMSCNHIVTGETLSV